MIKESPFLKPCISECSPSINVKAECSDSSENHRLTGEYFPVGKYNGRTIYEHSSEDINGMWWSLRFDDSANKWILKWQSQQIKVGEEHFESIIEGCLGQAGQFIANRNISHVTYGIFVFHFMLFTN